QSKERTLIQTLAGAYAPLGQAKFNGIRLPAFDKNRVIEDHEFYVFDQQCKYDVILGNDFLRKIGTNLKYETLEIEWLGNTVPMETLDGTNLIAAHVERYLADMEVEELGFDLDSYLAAPILDDKYDKLDVEEVITEHCAHLTLQQQADLRQLFSRHTKLFDGSLGRYPGEPMHIELKPGA
ncbi:hypothetical protein ACHAWF_003887, partial [Thalassiosira exigua]